MRNIVLALTFFLAIGLPILLILFAPGRRLAARITGALVAMGLVVAAFAMVQVIPALSNNAPDATQWQRFFGLVFSGSGFLMPWIVFAVFLHLKPKK